MIEQVGPMIISRKIMCTGEKIFGYIQPNANGRNTVRIIGIWIEMIYCMAFLRLA